MVNQMITYLNGATPRVLHRLDVDTSGLLLFAKHPVIASGVHKQFRCASSVKIRYKVEFGSVCSCCPWDTLRFCISLSIIHQKRLIDGCEDGHVHAFLVRWQTPESASNQ